MNAASLEEARAAKAVLRTMLRDLPGLRGLGITKVGGGYAVKVLVDAGTSCERIPGDVDGVPVVVDVAGTLTPL